MARTRRTVENVTVLTLSLIISLLMFYPLLLGIDKVGGSAGKIVHPMAIVMPQSDAESVNVPVSGILSAQKENIVDTDSDNLKKSYARNDLPGRQTGEYLPVALLTQRPAVLHDIDPELPESLRKLQPQSVQLLLLINEYGDIDQVELESVAALPTNLLDELRRHFQAMRFIPGRLDDRAVRSALRIRVRLHP
jgi:hypothetical protein